MSAKKMVLYNNALYNYLKLKKEVENTPLKVQVIKSSAGKDHQYKVQKIKKDHGNIRSENDDNLTSEDEDDEDAEDDDEYASDDKGDVKPSPHEKLQEVVYAQKEKFGIRGNQVLSDQGRVVSRSDVPHILKNLLDPYNRVRSNSVPGTELLRKRLLNDPLTRKFLIQRGSGLLKPYTKIKRRIHLW